MNYLDSDRDGDWSGRMWDQMRKMNYDIEKTLAGSHSYEKLVACWGSVVTIIPIAIGSNVGLSKSGFRNKCVSLLEELKKYDGAFRDPDDNAVHGIMVKTLADMLERARK